MNSSNAASPPDRSPASRISSPTTSSSAAPWPSSPTPGKAITQAILNGVARVFEDFHYVGQIEDGRRSVLEFEATVDGKSVHGIDMITIDDEGLITEFTVMVRPMSGAQALMAGMAAQFDRIEADARAFLERRP